LKEGGPGNVLIVVEQDALSGLAAADLTHVGPQLELFGSCFRGKPLLVADMHLEPLANGPLALFFSTFAAK
jgi:hypothetical protein